MGVGAPVGGEQPNPALILALPIAPVPALVLKLTLFLAQVAAVLALALALAPALALVLVLVPVLVLLLVVLVVIALVLLLVLVLVLMINGVVINMRVPETDVNAAVVACRFMWQKEYIGLQIRSDKRWCLGMHTCIPKKTNSAQTFQLLLSVELI